MTDPDRLARIETLLEQLLAEIRASRPKTPRRKKGLRQLPAREAAQVPDADKEAARSGLARAGVWVPR
jgi:hypothetical protein